MTLSTGKGGKYRYYTCNSRLNGGAEKCKSRSIPMDKLDRAVLASLAEKAFASNRVRTLLATLKTRFQSGHSREQQELALLKRELDAADQALSKLYEGVEKGILELDATLQTRAQGHKAKRVAILTEMAGLRRRQDLPLAGPERGQGASVLPSAQERVAWIEQGIRQALLACAGIGHPRRGESRYDHR